ncbi:MAG: fibronectin type III domain-containing protein, partial [Lachnospiraceae bacterium]|nr:fibronectin type III domain-containing protein [Lachnospiraceae bacterium]
KKYTFKVYAVRKSAGDFYAYNSKSYKKITAKTINEAITTEKFDVKGMDFSNDKYTFGVDGTYQAKGYELQLRTMAGVEKKTFTSAGFKKIVVEDLIKGHFYKYRVRTYIAFDSKTAYSKWSADKYIGVGEDAFGVISLKKIKITWKKVVDATGYEVSISTDGKNYWTLKTVPASSARKVTVTHVGGYRIRLNRRYYFRIRPISKDGKKTIKSEYTNDVSVILK